MRTLLVFILGITFFSSCTINRNVMFKTDEDFVFDTPDSVAGEYVVSPNDILMIQVFSNDGAKLINSTASSDNNGGRMMQNLSFSYTVEPDGSVKMPEVGQIDLEGQSIVEAQNTLQNEYKKFHNDPYVLIRILNNRIIVFPGSGGDAQVITLENNNTTVIEALARAGGIADRGDASEVKLIRKEDLTDKIYHMDLSTIEGIQYAQMIVQANDIIYVEPVPEIAREIFNDVSPIVQIVSGLALIWAIVTTSFGQ